METARSSNEMHARGTFSLASHEHFWHKLEDLASHCRVVIDRPRGTPHPRYPSVVYPLDYGYLEGSHSGDGDGIDVWVGSLPERRVTAVIVCIDADKRDAEIKILLSCTSEEMEKILATHNSGGQAGVLIRKTEEAIQE